MFNRKSKIKNRKSAFTLVEILVSVGVLSILGVALVGLMMAGVSAWRDGEAARQVQEKVQALQRQIADDLAAAIVDPPPAPDFHYALDTLADLPKDTTSPYYIVWPSSPVQSPNHQPVSGSDLWYFGTGQVVLQINVPFAVGAALLAARMDALDSQSDVRLEVARNDPSATGPPSPVSWQDVLDVGSKPVWLNPNHTHNGAIGGAETDISALVQGGTTIFIRATMTSSTGGNAQFLRADTLRSEGRPVLILDCYRDPNALPQRPRPLFKTWFENGSQVLMFTRTIPGETEKAVLRNAGTGSGYLNYSDPVTSLQPIGGRANVVYRIMPYLDQNGNPDAGKPGLGVLCRSFEAPIGRPLDDLTDPNMAKLAFELIPNVAYFGVSFWGGDTTTWEPNPELDPKYAGINPPPHPASQRWLSGRYLPEQAHVTLVIEPDGGRRVTTALARPLAVGDTGPLTVDNTRGFYSIDRSSDTAQTFLRDPRHYIKICDLRTLGSPPLLQTYDEWVYYDDVASSAVFSIPATGRGQRGTTARDHPPETEVLRGTTAVFTVPIPAFRNWQR